MATTPQPTLDRRQAVAAVLAPRGQAMVVAGLGSSCYDTGAAGDHPLNFYLWGAMGGAAMIGLGLALAQPARPVVVITGDGEMLMGMSSLATIATMAPPNLALVIIDNELYAETGMQPTHTARGVDLAGVARATGFPRAATVRTQAELDAIIPSLYRPEGPCFVAVKVTAARYPMQISLRDGPYIKNRFREALLGPEALA